MFRKFILLYLTFLTLSGSNTVDDHKKPRVVDNSISTRLDNIEHNIDTLQKYINNLINIDANNKGADSGKFIETDDVIAQFKSINSELEKLNYANTKINEKISKISSDLEYRISRLEKLEGASTKGSDSVINKVEDILSKTDIQAVDNIHTSNYVQNDTPEEEYQKAFNMLKNTSGNSKEDEENKDKAKEAFIKFITHNPGNSLIGNARYWIGEIYFSRSLYDKAAVEYLEGFKSGGVRASKNLLGLANCLVKLGKSKEACTTLMKLKQDFPNAEGDVKRIATNLMKQSGCRVTSYE